MGLPEQRMSRDAPLDAADVTDEHINRLHRHDHLKSSEEQVWYHAVLGRMAARRRVLDQRYRAGNERPVTSSGNDDADVFDFATRK